MKIDRVVTFFVEAQDLLDESDLERLGRGLVGALHASGLPVELGVLGLVDLQ